MTRAERHAQIMPLHQQGMSSAQIAGQLGCSTSLVRHILSDPDGSKQRARQRRRLERSPRFPASRVQPVIREWVDRENLGCDRGQGGITRLIQQTGVPARTIWAILHGERETLSLGVVDALLCGIGRTDLFHTEFADIYEREAA